MRNAIFAVVVISMYLRLGWRMCVGGYGRGGFGNANANAGGDHGGLIGGLTKVDSAVALVLLISMCLRLGCGCAGVGGGVPEAGLCTSPPK